MRKEIRELAAKEASEHLKTRSRGTMGMWKHPWKAQEEGDSSRERAQRRNTDSVPCRADKAAGRGRGDDKQGARQHFKQEQ